jgi:CheY-like chemotaxis protein
LYLPQSYAPQKPARKSGSSEHSIALAPKREADVSMPEPEELQLVNEVGDDRLSIHDGDRVLLIVENDLNFAKFMLDVARERGFKGLVTSLGAAALAMRREYNPDAITLDICLPDIDGWRVLERLKNDLNTRHIPVCIISTEDVRERGLRLGARSVVSKPIQTKEVLERALDDLMDVGSRPVKEVLLWTQDITRKDRITELFDGKTIRVTSVDSDKEALNLLRRREADCMIFDGRLPDDPADTLANAVAQEPALADIPLIAYTEGAAERDDDAGLKALAHTANLHPAHSPERLLDQATLFLHAPVADLPESHRRKLEHLHQADTVLAGRKVLIVDDDIRNIFALTSVLEWHNMSILAAETGREAIRILQEEPGIDIVLMDIMMPEMDGLDTTRAIRQIPGFRALPIIAVTAKAMKGDREKCIEAGAWDYLSKPVDSEQMLAVLRGWLHR